MVQQAITTGGTGNLTLGSAVAGYTDLNTVYGLNRICNYCLTDGNNREIGLGYLSAATTFVRQKVLETLSAGAYNNLTATALSVSTSAILSLDATSQTIPISPGYAALGVANPVVMSAFSEGNAGFNPLINTLHMFPFYLPIPGIYTGIGMLVTAAAAGNAVLGLYLPTSDTDVRLLASAVVSTGT